MDKKNPRLGGLDIKLRPSVCVCAHFVDPLSQKQTAQSKATYNSRWGWKLTVIRWPAFCLAMEQSMVGLPRAMNSWSISNCSNRGSKLLPIIRADPNCTTQPLVNMVVPWTLFFKLQRQTRTGSRTNRVAYPVASHTMFSQRSRRESWPSRGERREGVLQYRHRQ